MWEKRDKYERLLLTIDKTVMSVCLPVKTCFCDRQLTYFVQNVISSVIIYVGYM